MEIRKDRRSNSLKFGVPLFFESFRRSLRSLRSGNEISRFLLQFQLFGQFTFPSRKIHTLFREFPAGRGKKETRGCNFSQGCELLGKYRSRLCIFSRSSRHVSYLDESRRPRFCSFKKHLISLSTTVGETLRANCTKVPLKNEKTSGKDSHASA